MKQNTDMSFAARMSCKIFTRRRCCMLNNPFVQAQIKENIKAPGHWPLCIFPFREPVMRKIFPFLMPPS